MISIILFFLAGCARGLAELVGYEHGDSIFSAKVPQHSFWGAQQWKRKYRMNSYGSLHFLPYPGMSNLAKWYYRVFKIRYRERFLFSATALAWLTDGMHLTNFLMKFFLIGACISYDPVFKWPVMVGAYILAWTGGFNLTYSFIFQKRLK